MKTLKVYISESMNTVNSGVDEHIRSLIEDTLAKIDFKEFKSFSFNDSDRFDISKENEKLFIDAFEDSELKAMSSVDYYDANHSDKFKNLSATEKAKADSMYGDVILVDENNNAKYYIDLKISNNHYIGAISMGSIVSFDENGIYVCIDTYNNVYKIVSHKVISDLVKDGDMKVNSAVNSYKGYEVEFNGETYQSEDFIKGNDIKRLIK